MSKPAARIGDMTAHGGVIVVGQPNVLIGGMPAARATDMHTCPMFNGPQPHVGGPVAMGSTGVLIGGMPAARVGDMATCAGPPDPIVMGCFTVLIGETMPGGGGGGAGAGSPGAAGANASAAAAQFDNNESTTKEKHWVEFEFVDKAGLPVSGVHYAFKDPSGKESEGQLRLDGTVRRDALEEGQCEVVLKDVYGADWDTRTIATDDKVRLSAKVEGYADGTPARLIILKRDVRDADAIVAELHTKVSGGKIEAQWAYEYPESATSDEYNAAAVSDTPAYSDPAYYFEAVVNEQRARSPLLNVKDTIEIELVDTEEQPLGNLDYELVTSSGSVRRGTLDGQGRTTEKKVPPAGCVVRFPDLPDVDAAAHPYDATAPSEEKTEDGTGGNNGKIRLQVFDAEGAALGGAAYTLTLGQRVIEGTTDRNGWLEPFDPAGASEGKIEIQEQVYQVTFVDQIDGLEGVQARLNALGFNAGPVDGKYGPQTRSALTYYQEARYLEPTGEPDDVTVDSLKQEFGE